jgi:hypothetical protein
VWLMLGEVAERVTVATPGSATGQLLAHRQRVAEEARAQLERQGAQQDRHRHHRVPVTPGMPPTAASIGIVTCCSTTSGDAPGDCVTTVATGVSIEVRSSGHNEVVLVTPNTATSTVIRVTIARLAKLRRVSQVIKRSPRTGSVRPRPM